jgi:hypothetical protein
MDWRKSPHDRAQASVVPCCYCMSSYLRNLCSHLHHSDFFYFYLHCSAIISSFNSCNYKAVSVTAVNNITFQHERTND